MIDTFQGIVLRAEDQGEYDKRLTLYTRELGKIKVKVVGVKKTASKLRGFTLPFTESRLQVYLHGAKRSGLRDPGKIVGGDGMHHHAKLRDDWEKLIQCSALCETLETLTHPFYQNEKEYDLLSETLHQMEKTPHPVLLKLRFTLMLLKILGYSLRHHSTWNGYSAPQKDLLMRLALWDTVSSGFSAEETRWMERATQSYLRHYLPSPLKTDMFQQKINGMAEAEASA